GCESQARAAASVAEGRFASQVLPLDAPDLDGSGRPTGTTHHVDGDECLRPTTLDGLGGLNPVLPDGLHTAGTSSQIADAASAVMLMRAERARELGVAPRAKLVDSCLIAGDPVLQLTGPIEATR